MGASFSTPLRLPISKTNSRLLDGLASENQSQEHEVQKSTLTEENTIQTPELSASQISISVQQSEKSNRHLLTTLSQASTPKPALPEINNKFCTNSNEVKDPCSAQWMMLYTYAAYASEIPDDSERRMLLDFYNYFPDQCTTSPFSCCYSEALKTMPPRVNNRRELLLWLCSIENRCRKQAGEPTRLCRYDDLMKRWRYADGYL